MKKDTIRDYYNEYELAEPKEIMRYCNLGSNYVFRGQSSYDWRLATSFEREVKSVDWSGWYDLEDKIIFEFKRQAHHYISHLPTNNLEWLALMQHYGCPTRLLDFTRSFWIALFFAIDGANSDSAVWIIDTSYYVKRDDPMWKDYRISSYNKIAEEEINAVLKGDNEKEFKSGVIFAEPAMLNQRLSIQKGLFAFPTALNLTFWKNLSSHSQIYDLKDDETTYFPIIHKVKIPVTMHGELIQLLTSMNISSATLYPGLSGFAKSLANHIRFAENHEKMLGEARKEAMDKHVQSLCDSMLDE